MFSVPEVRLIFLDYYSQYGKNNFSSKDSLVKHEEVFFEAVFNIIRSYYFD